MALTAHWIQNLNNWQNSGITQAAYCREHQLNMSKPLLHGYTILEIKSPHRRLYRTGIATGNRFAGIAYRSRLTTGAAHNRFSAMVGRVAAMPGLIETPPQIWLAVALVDMRKGIDGLSAIVQQALNSAPCAGAAFVFRNRAGTRLKLLLWDGNGVWLCQRRLYRGHFIWPRHEEAVFSVTEAQWRWLVAGVDWQRLSALPSADWHP